MSGQKSEHPVTRDGNVVGSLTVFQQGLFTVFDCTCRSSERDVLRLAAVCGGRYVPIGVMAPEDGALRLKKRFSRNALAEAGYSPTSSFRLVKDDELQKGPGEPAPTPQGEPELAAGDAPAGLEFIAPEAALPFEDASDSRRGAADAPTDLRASEASQGIGEVPSDILAEEIVPTVDVGAGTAGDAVASGQEPGPDEALSSDKLLNLSKLLENFSMLMPGGAAGQSGDPRTKTGEMEAQGAAEKDLLSELGCPDGFRPMDDVGALFSDPEVRAACAGVRGAMAKRNGDFVLLAVPLSADEPFPMMPVFCFGSYSEIGGRDYIVFKIRDGNLAL